MTAKRSNPIPPDAIDSRTDRFAKQSPRQRGAPFARKFEELAYGDWAAAVGSPNSSFSLIAALTNFLITAGLI
jgi:hypothetical protein